MFTSAGLSECSYSRNFSLETSESIFDRLAVFTGYCSHVSVFPPFGLFVDEPVISPEAIPDCALPAGEDEDEVLSARPECRY